jgi:DeoR family fructose operon transcriptional repressor
LPCHCTFLRFSDRSQSAGPCQRVVTILLPKSENKTRRHLKASTCSGSRRVHLGVTPTPGLSGVTCGRNRPGECCRFVHLCAITLRVSGQNDHLRSQLPAGRRSDLAKYLDVVGQVTVHELADRYGVSIDTIRRDLDYLHSGGRVVRTHGGAMSVAVHPADRGFSVRLHLQASEKETIGALAADLVADGSIVIINAGTTTLAVARALHNRRDLTIATNNLLLPGVISEKAFRELYVFGGVMRIHTQSTTGPVRFPTADGQHISISADLAMVAVGAVSADGGYTSSTLSEALMMREMIQQSAKVAVLADSSKFDRRQFATVGDLGLADYLVTDREPPPALRQALDDAGVVVVCPRPGSLR